MLWRTEAHTNNCKHEIAFRAIESKYAHHFVGGRTMWIYLYIYTQNVEMFIICINIKTP